MTTSQFNTSYGWSSLQDWDNEKTKALKKWDYPCPICGELTIRDSKFDHMYRKECHGLGWKCPIGGYAHFHQAAWNPLRKKLVFTEKNHEVPFPKSSNW